MTKLSAKGLLMKTATVAATLLALGGDALAQASDDCAGATSISGIGAFPYSTLGSTDSGMIGSCNNPPSSDVWFTWTSGPDTDYHFSICNTDFDTVFVLYDGCGGAACRGRRRSRSHRSCRPRNDACASAEPIAGTGLFAFDNSVALTDGIGDLACQAFASDQIHGNVWFECSAPVPGTYAFETCGLTGFDTRLAVYDLQACPPGAALACDDDACLFQSRIELHALAGQRYLLRVGSWSPITRGEGHFEVALVAPPANDLCGGATPIAGGGPFDFDNTHASTDGPAAPACWTSASSQIERDVWFAWSAPADGRFRATTCDGTTLDTRIAVHVGATCPPASAIACGDNECGVQGSASFAASAGQTYLIRVGSFGDVYRGPGSFVIDTPPVPANDACANAHAIAGTGSFAFDNEGAATDGLPEPGCESFSASEIHNDVWFRWTATASAQYQVETCALTDLDTRVAVFTDQGCRRSDRSHATTMLADGRAG